MSRPRPHSLRRLFPLLLAGPLAIGACQKDEEPVIQLDGLYEAQSTVKAGPLQLYTSNGIITTPAVIAAYMKRRFFANYGFLRRDSTLRPDQKLTLLFQGNNRVTLTSSYNGFSQVSEHEVSSQSAQHYVLAGLDSVSIASSRTSGFCDVVAQKIQEFAPVQRCKALAPGSGGATQLCRFRPLRVIALQNGQPVLPLLNWILTVNRPGWSCGFGESNNWNSVSPTLPAGLVPGDTVLLQRNELRLQKI